MILAQLYTYLLFRLIPHIQQLGIAEDFVKGIEKSIKNFLADGIKSNFSTILSLINSGMSEDGIGGTVSSYLQNTPSGVDGTLWSNIQNISEIAVVPVAVTIVTIISCCDLCQMVISGNNMRDFDTSIFFKWIFKTIIAISLCSNVFLIVSEVFNLGNDVTVKAYNLLGVTMDSSSIDVNAVFNSILKSFNMGELALMLLLSFVTLVIIYVMFGCIMVVLCSRMIEAMMYLSIAPIPMATMMQSEWRQIGNSWLRGLIAIAFQGFFIVIALAFFGSMFAGVLGTITDESSASSVIWAMVKLIGFSLALIFTIFRTDRISKSMFAAH